MPATIIRLPGMGSPFWGDAVWSLRPAVSSLRRQGQQTRRFRRGCGWWISPVETDLHREGQRRERILRYRYTDALHQKLQREEHQQTVETQRLFKRLASHHRRGIERGDQCSKRPGFQRVRAPEHPAGMRPGQNIEDVERGPMERLLFGDRDLNRIIYDYWSSPIENVRKYFVYRKHHNTGQAADLYPPTTDTGTPDKTAASVVRGNHPVKQDDYVIDPITNRKVVKNASPPREETDVEIPAKTFINYRAQFTKLRPPSMEDPAATATLKSELCTADHRESDQTAMGRALQQGGPPSFPLATHSRPQSSMVDASISTATSQPVEARSGADVDSSAPVAPASSDEPSGPDTVEQPEVDRHKPAGASITDGIRPIYQSAVSPRIEGHRVRDVVVGGESQEPTEPRTPSSITYQGQNSALFRMQDGMSPTPSGTDKVSGDDVERSRSRHRLEDIMSRLRTASDAADLEATATLRSIKTEESLPMVPTDGTLGSKVAPTDSRTGSRAPVNSGDSVAAVSLPTIHFPTSLDRTSASSEATTAEEQEQTLLDPFLAANASEISPTSSNPDLLSSTQGAGRQSPETREGIRVADDKLKAALTATGQENREPTVYKILAYDPTMQTINTATTSSVVADSAAALTPAEVLLRLSNPAKFFPHFAPLQAQGFEIVSGSGDVLVFRKVRGAVVEDASAMPTRLSDSNGLAATLPKPSSPSAYPPTPGVNPIDMTGHSAWHNMSPASANFASPTGYVNYDFPALRDDGGSRLPPSPPPPPSPNVRSHVDAGRKEPAFRGVKHSRESEANGRKGVATRVLVGALWVGAVSYALGVVGEYFKTGGIDGMGPRGF